MALWLQFGTISALGVITSAVLWVRHLRRQQSLAESSPSSWPILPTTASAIAVIALMATGIEATRGLPFDQRVTSIGGSVGLLLSLTSWALWSRPKNRESHRFLLLAIFTSALTLLLVTMLWLTFANPPISRAELLKTGGLTSGALVATYALWLNDRRRRVEESRQKTEEDRRIIEQKRQQLEYDRAEHDRERVADEYFARAVELLGNEADQVRVGALHALLRLTRTRPEYGQTVADIFCAYLRRPIDLAPSDMDDSSANANHERERHVRRTVERLIETLLSTTPTKEQALEIDLSGANIQSLNLRNCIVGDLKAENASFRGVVRFSDTHFQGSVWMSGASFREALHINSCTFEIDVNLTNAVLQTNLVIVGPSNMFHGPVLLQQAWIVDEIYIWNSSFAMGVNLALSESPRRFDIKNSRILSKNQESILRPATWNVEVDSSTGEFHIETPPPSAEPVSFSP